MSKLKKKWKLLFLLAVLLLIPIALIGAWLASATFSNTNPRFGEHVGKVDWLPVTATDVSFFRSYSNTAYEFQMRESEFILWAEDELDWAPDFELKEIEGAFEIARYTAVTPQSHFDPESRDTGTGNPHELAPVAIISEGLFYRTPPRPNGGGTYVAYDRRSGRGYYQDSPR